MWKHVCTLTVCLMLGLVTLAFSSNRNKPGNHNNAAVQADNSDRQANKERERTIEGCIIREETVYFIQPPTGQRTRLNAGKTDLSSHVGQNARVSGTTSADNSSASKSQSSTSPGTETGELLVTRVDMISEKCPAN